MEDDHRYRVEYGENVVPKYPARNDEGLEVVPNDSPLYPMPAHSPLHTVGENKWESSSKTSADAAAAATPEKGKDGERRRIMGLTVPWFWAVIVILIVILAAGIGGGVGGGIQTQQRLRNNAGASSDTTSTLLPSSTLPTPTSGAASGPLPSDSGCPLIQGQTYTPYAADGKSIPLEPGLEGQQFRQQCYTNYVSSAATHSHDILRIFMPTLENCIMACAEYNSAYRASINGDVDVGGGYCVGVTIAKVNAGFCYLKNSTSTNDTMGQPNTYSSAVLLTDLNTTLV
ncbi:uncharacterized protein GGS25DRAFT_524754 [Hypoxylon fragiforme]|uniref:uncharacterized protein n=1 Tax=Hypoxylon fragiforme TaxID=63214 RepID=UPI0020C5DB34|nr:uncharacterized protein GGS25DRAFT_524754 [Hypoxylon fragiforme]KAI2605236.1 hypothetical protein GGS25DRAFT_524754 [Hypoxylon fragiforme]